MLVLSRKEGQRIRIGEDIVITLVSCKNGKAKIGIDAPRAVPVVRSEIDDREHQELGLVKSSGHQPHS